MPIENKATVKNNTATNISSKLDVKGNGDLNCTHAPDIEDNSVSGEINTDTVLEDQRAVAPSDEQMWFHIFRRALQAVWSLISRWWNRGK
ncbi:hypothetical protein AALO_G00252830 [Alosa alosa]|uniref:Uncharacterized protein n=1 Tax=Alosa alosa TaxID=278164 RepID=A0AAV6FNQ4_9TELE|nr:hypothetical protein AALO_G00252830 [Alosa alosa]